MKTHYFGYKKFAVHDGDGVRTTLFLSGCPLHCKWCHNPEGIKRSPILAYYENKCIGCGECVSVCPTGAHVFQNEAHRFERKKCIACGKCESVCLGKALTFYGREIDVETAVKILSEDKAFYGSDGGATLSGGECLLSPDFCAEVEKKLLSLGIKTDIDTCGDVDFSAFEKVIPTTDVFLYDLKAIGSDVHTACTGRSNQRILDNFDRLMEKGAKVEVRYPFVPEHNDGEAEKIAEFLEGKPIVGIRILPYHDYARSKYIALGFADELPERKPTQDEINRTVSLFTARGVNVIE